MKREWAKMTAEPVICDPWDNTAPADTSGAELQKIIILGFSYHRWNDAFVFVKTFTLKEHGEFFRAVAILGRVSYSQYFYESLQRHGAMKVTITRSSEEG
jgi:hypothetical protein